MISHWNTDSFLEEPCFDCPRQCGVLRGSGKGICGADGRLRIASLCAHRGEEPAISGARGSITVFLPGCNLRCVFCQNWQISRRDVVARTPALSLDEAVQQLTDLIDAGGHNLNFVSPSHNVPQVRALVEAVRERGRQVPVVYNSNGYDSVEALRFLEGLVDVYLPDMKYGEPAASARWSGAKDYVETATAALTEMRRQVGEGLELDDDGLAQRGIIVRHLVLPGQVENSLRALDRIAEILTPEVHISLMAQYHPDAEAIGDPELGRFLTSQEYDQVVDHAMALGFENGWIQDLEESPGHYRPDFEKESHPFE